MASPATVGLKIWACTIFFNAIILGIVSLFTHNLSRMIMSLVMLVGGYIVTSPLVFIIILLVKLSTRIPYGIAAKKIWLGFILSLLIVFLFLCLSWSVEKFIRAKDVYMLAGISMAALFISILCMPGSLREIYTQQPENTNI